MQLIDTKPGVGYLAAHFDFVSYYTSQKPCEVSIVVPLYRLGNGALKRVSALCSNRQLANGRSEPWKSALIQRGKRLLTHPCRISTLCGLFRKAEKRPWGATTCSFNDCLGFLSIGGGKSPDYSLPNNLALSCILNCLVSLLFNSTWAGQDKDHHAHYIDEKIKTYFEQNDHGFPSYSGRVYPYHLPLGRQKNKN